LFVFQVAGWFVAVADVPDLIWDNIPIMPHIPPRCVKARVWFREVRASGVFWKCRFVLEMRVCSGAQGRRARCCSVNVLRATRVPGRVSLISSVAEEIGGVAGVTSVVEVDVDDVVAAVQEAGPAGRS
jgi:hypothetical protein